MSTYLPEPTAPLLHSPAPTSDVMKHRLRRFIRFAATLLFVLVNVGLIYWAVDGRSGLIASQAPIREAELEPEFVSLAVKSAVVVTTAGVAFSYLIARAVEVYALSRLRVRRPKAGRAHSVDLITAVVFAYAAFLDTEAVSLAGAAPGWLFILVPPAVVVLQFMGDRQTGRKAILEVLALSGVLCALTLLAYGRWF